MLSTTRYATLCVAGTEIFYILCLPFGLLLSAKGKELHAALFELIPGFVTTRQSKRVFRAIHRPKS